MNRIILPLIISLYLLLAALYAINIPKWQARATQDTEKIILLLDS